MKEINIHDQAQAKLNELHLSHQINSLIHFFFYLNEIRIHDNLVNKTLIFLKIVLYYSPPSKDK